MGKMDDHTTTLYNNIFKVVHYTRQNPGDWNYLLCQRNRDGRYFVYAVPNGHTLKDKRVNVKKFLTGFYFGKGSYDYAGSVMMDIVEKADAYFTDNNLTVVWSMEEESYDMYPTEIRDDESGVNSPDR